MIEPVKLTMLLTILLAFTNVPAVNIYECVDEDGNSTFQDRCPPGTTPKSEKKYGSNQSNDETGNTAAISVILYYIPQCRSCNMVREFFSNRNIKIVEKNIENNIQLQDELKSKVGSLSVPTVDINGEYVTGYNESVLMNIAKKYN